MAKKEILNKLREVVSVAKGTSKKVKVVKAIIETPNAEIQSTEIPATEIPSTEIPNVEIPNAEILSTEIPSAEIPNTEIASSETNTASAPSLFDMMQSATEEDDKITSEKTRLEHIADSITDDELNDEDLDLNEDSPTMKKEMADVKATAVVEFGELIMSLLCMWIADDWSTEAQEKKFIISPKRKKAIKISIMRIMIAKKGKTNPTLSIIMLCVGSAVPMLVVAMITRVQKKRDAGAQAELLRQQRELIIERDRQATERYTRALDENKTLHNDNVTNILDNAPERIKTPSKMKNLSVVSSEKRGRHKKTCKSFSGGKCNCKG